MKTPHRGSSASRAGRLPRRDFLLTGLGAAAAGALPAGVRTRRARAADLAGAGRARNLIFLVPDGMSAGTLTLDDLHRHMLDGRPSRWIELFSEHGARRALMETASLDGHVTDSAAAASAWGIGQRVYNGSVNTTSDGREPAPLFVRAARRGMAQGLVTTTRLTDATPAGFVANALRRSFEPQIAQQIVERGVDVLLGGGGRYLTDEVLGEGVAPRVMRTRDELLGMKGGQAGRVVGIFAEDHMNYEIDRRADEPSLAEMTAAALTALQDRPDGFILHIEGARVDHAAHANDAVGLVHDMRAFDDALSVAADFCLERGDTLLIAATDHANANPGLASYAPDGTLQFERLLKAEHSLAWVLRELGAHPRRLETTDALVELIARGLKITLRDEEIRTLDRWVSGESVDPYDRRNRRTSPIGSLISNHFGVAFTGPDHTSDHVEALALGPGAERLAPFIGIEKLHDLAVESLGLEPA
ncbi:MAG: alkaline phosphatase [Phycisphaeraceae bacterium]|nr:MAG: alkaline phosphatase [Phycisphaeraceae bacterium]